MDIIFDLGDYHFTDLKFEKSGNDLIIKNKEEEIKKLNYTKNFFINNYTAKIQAKDEKENLKIYTFKNDIKIILDINNNEENIIGTEYNDIIDLTNVNNSAEIDSNLGDDIIISNNKINTFLINKNSGNDTIKNITENDTIKFNDINFEDLEFSTNENNLTVNYQTGSIVLENVIQDNEFEIKPKFKINDTEIENLYINNCFNSSDFIKGKLILKNNKNNCKIIASDYVSKTKGVTIQGFEGNSYILGSNYNDKILLKNGNNNITEINGKNIIKTGSGNNVLNLKGYSSNTVNLGNGTNNINIENIGYNKITSGKGNDIITATNGVNTINVGLGENQINLNGGINNVKSGNDKDTYTVTGGNNTIKSSNGDDIYTVTGGYNNILTGKGNRIFNIEAGNNTIKTGKTAKNDNFIITGGNNIIDSSKGNSVFKINNGINQITSGKANDIFTIKGGYASITDKGGKDNYYLDEIENYNNIIISINDTKGDNHFFFNEDIKSKIAYFDVNVGKKAKLIKGTNNYKYSTGKTVTFASLDETDHNLGITIAFNKNKEIGMITVNSDNYTLDINNVAQNVANWLATSSEGYKSTEAVFASGNKDDINALIALYQGFIGSTKPYIGWYKIY